MKYEPVIGLEVHVELNTKSKMFCRCSADYFGQDSNTHTCPVCLGLPGALPFINEEAIKSCLKIGLALNCQITDLSRFERKNYFYPDLPKGFQISQYRWPLCTKGWIEVIGEEGKMIRVKINRVHQEEDTAKLIYQSGTQNSTQIDFNRSGVPLVEIVTEPDFHDTAAIKNYAKKLQQIVRFLGVSNADMERGDLRLEANVSVCPKGIEGLPNYRIELKNINSFRFMVAAVEYEIKRQEEALDRGEKLVQETRGWDEDKKQTYLQRSKEQAHDYRYFPEPDLPELRISSQELRIKEEMAELPETKVKRYVSNFGLARTTAEILASEKTLAEFFEKLAALAKKEGLEIKQIANFLVNQKINLASANLSQIIQNLKAKTVNLIDNQTELEKVAQEVIEENPGMVEQYQKGKITIIQALIGAVMKKTSGRANPNKTREILEKLLRR